MKVSNADLREEIYRSKLSYTDLSRQAQRALPFPDLYADSWSDIPDGFAGLVKLHHARHLPDDFAAPFEPFQLVRDGEVIASAFVRDGQPSVHGRLTERLGILIYQLVTNYARKPNWSGYTFKDDMIGFALEQAIPAALKFDERKTSNPFAFLTTNTFYAFEKVRKKEAALAKHRADVIGIDMGSCQWSAWCAAQDSSDDATMDVYQALRSEMDALLVEEERRRGRTVNPARRQKHKLTTMTPVLSAAIKYGLGLGLPGRAIAIHFGLDQATVTRVKNGRR